MFFLHAKFPCILPILGATNFKPSEYKKSTKLKKKNHFPYSCFKMDSIAFKKIISYIILSNALYEHCQT